MRLAADLHVGRAPHEAYKEASVEVPAWELPVMLALLSRPLL